MALKQTSKVNNWKLETDVEAAMNELDIQKYMSDMYEKVKELKENSNTISEGYRLISKMI